MSTENGSSNAALHLLFLPREMPVCFADPSSAVSSRKQEIEISIFETSKGKLKLEACVRQPLSAQFAVTTNQQAISLSRSWRNVHTRCILVGNACRVGLHRIWKLEHGISSAARNARRYFTTRTFKLTHRQRYSRNMTNSPPALLSTPSLSSAGVSRLQGAHQARSMNPAPKVPFSAA